MIITPALMSVVGSYYATKYIAITKKKNIWFMLFREIRTVYCVDHGEYVKSVFKMHNSGLLRDVVHTVPTVL